MARRGALAAILAIVIGGISIAVAYRLDGTQPNVDSIVGRALAAEAYQLSPGDTVMVKKKFVRPGPPDPLTDPYHLSEPPGIYGETISTVWIQVNARYEVERRHLILERPDGTLIQEEYTDGRNEWVYRAQANETEAYEIPEPLHFTGVSDVDALKDAAPELVYAGTEAIGGRKVDILESPAQSSAGSGRIIQQWGIERTTGSIVVARTFTQTPAGNRELIESTEIMGFVVDPPAPDFSFAPKGAQTIFDGETSTSEFVPPAQVQVSIEEASATAPFTFFVLPAEAVEARETYRSVNPSDWSQLSLDQRHLQYASSTTSAYRTVGQTSAGRPFTLIQGTDAELARVLASTPPLWESSWTVQPSANDDLGEYWLAASTELDTTFAIGEMGGTLVVLAVVGADPVEAGALFERLQRVE